MSIEENKAIVARFWEAWNTGDLAAIDEVVASDYLWHAPSPTRLGADGVKRTVTTMRASFPDLKVMINQMVAEADRVVSLVTARGTHTGAGFTHRGTSIPSTGKTVEYTVMDIYRIEEGRIVENWAVVDRLSLLEQLGLVAPASQVAG